MRKYTLLFVVVGFLLHSAFVGQAQSAASRLTSEEPATEADFSAILNVPSPEGVLLEVGGLATLPNGDLAVTTRRGDVFIVENPTGDHPFFRTFASGLHEVLGVAYKNGALYCAQRAELTRLTDTDQDGKADLFETIYAFPLSGNYCEYNYGPKIAPDGSFFVTCNLAFPEDIWWRPYSPVLWRGWTLRISETGQVTPWATGMRSPAGLGMIDGELFYADNQGDWIGSGGLVHLKKGAFTGNPAGLRWTSTPGSPLKLTQQELFARVNPRVSLDDRGRDRKPENVVNERAVTLAQLKAEFPEIQLPAVWLPHGVLGISNSEIVKIPQEAFGPFAGQVLIGDQGQSKIMRVFLEKVNDQYQGAAWDFRNGFQSGVLRLAWAGDGSLFVGETSRGWGSAGGAREGLQRLVWNNNRTPFEMRTIRAMPDGFEIEFTKPVDRRSAEDLSSYAIERFTYKYQPVYGSPPVNKKKCRVIGINVSEDGMRVRIVVDSLQRFYVHAISLEGIREREHTFSLVHPTAYYTLNAIPEGPALPLRSLLVKSPPVGKSPTPPTGVNTSNGTRRNPSASGQAASSRPEVVAYAVVKPLLQKHTCLACHNPDKRQVGPAFKDVARRRYSDQEIVELIHSPKPENWPDYETPMPALPQVPAADARKIAAWINSLNRK